MSKDLIRINDGDRQCRPVFNRCGISSSDEDDCRDPFKCSDSENDPDYHVPKKARTDKSNPILKGTKKLTPHDRIARLKRKTHMRKDAQNVVWSSVNAHSTNPINLICSTSSAENVKNNIDEELSKSPKASGDTATGSSFQNFDHLFDCEKGIDLTAKTESNVPAKTVENVPMCIDNYEPNAPNSVIFEVILGLRDKMDDMANNVSLLRKQVSRLEMKTLGGPAQNNDDDQMPIQSKHLVDFDATLAEEGLPFTTCVEFNAFEEKLRHDTKYKEKMVRFCILFHTVCLLARSLVL